MNPSNHATYPPEPVRFTDNVRYAIYFLRELTGPIIALYIIFFVIASFFDPARSFISRSPFKIISIAAFVASIIHTVTWLRASVKITPFNLSTTMQMALFLLLIASWIAASLYVLPCFYFSSLRCLI